MDEKKIKELANRFYNLLAPWNRINTTPEETAERIRNNPLEVIEFLLETIEDLLEFLQDK